MRTTEETQRQIRHTLRGELHTIMLCVDAASSAATPAEQLEWLGFVEASCDRVLALLDRATAPPGDDDPDPAH